MILNTTREYSNVSLCNGLHPTLLLSLPLTHISRLLKHVEQQLLCASGGWSDTPPIAFEHGGSVTIIAVKVDGTRPIGARARRIREPRLLLVSYSGARRGSGVSTETVCDSLDDLRDYCQPHAPGRRWTRQMG